MSDRVRANDADHRSDPDSTLRYGDRLGRYVVTGFAGRGTTSYVYRARREHSFEPLAIKVLHPHLVVDPAKRRQFYREARLMLRMDHPNVVQFHEILEVEGKVGFVMDYIDGVTLSTWVSRQQTTVDQQTVVGLFVDILRGVAHAHRNGVIHRDLKPSNIMITEGEHGLRAEIIDFGVGRARDEGPTDRDREKIVGTPAYISPEEVRDPEDVCASSDLYSLGVMMFETACGRRPFSDGSSRELLAAHVSESPPPPRSLNPELSDHLEEIILKTLEKRPESRFRSADEMIDALEETLRRSAEGRTRGPSVEDHIATREW
ncbi:MAG: serine/threonine-protein kinase, partial [Bradymonadaceae bacterium]